MASKGKKKRKREERKAAKARKKNNNTHEFWPDEDDDAPRNRKSKKKPKQRQQKEPKASKVQQQEDPASGFTIPSQSPNPPDQMPDLIVEPQRPREPTPPPTPTPEPPREWHDVTKLVNAITKDMTLGNMIHDQDFTLHAAMTALEIGDGVLDNAMKERLLYFEDIISDHDLISRLAKVEEDQRQLIGTMDELLRLLWSFMSGNSDQHSIYSCLFLYEDIEKHPEMPPNPTLNLFIDAVKTCCGFARAIVSRSRMHEEDDWSKIKTFEFRDFEQSRIDVLVAALIKKIGTLKKSGKLSENSGRIEIYKVIPGTDQHRQNLKNGRGRKFSKTEFDAALCCRFEMVAVFLNVVSRMHNVAVYFRHHLEQKTMEEEKQRELERKEAEAANSKKKKRGTNKNGKQSKQQQNQRNHHSKKGKGGNQSNHKKKGNQQKQNKGKQKGKGGGSSNHNKKKGGNQHHHHQQNQNHHNKGNQHQQQQELTVAKREDIPSFYILDHNPRSECTLSTAVVLKHKSMLHELKEFSSMLLRIVKQCGDTIGMGMHDPPGFDARIGGHKAVHAPRRQRVPSRVDMFDAFKEWCKCLRFVTDLTKVESFDGFIEFLDAMNRRPCCPNIVIRALLVAIIEEWTAHSNFLWTRKPMVHWVQHSFRDFDDWCRCWSWTKKMYIGDFHTFHTRVVTAIRDIVRQKLLSITRQMEWTERNVKNWQILQTESPQLDQLAMLSYLDGFDAKYRHQINMMEEYKPAEHCYTQWLVSSCCDSQIDYILMHCHPVMRLYADYELESVYFYLEYLFRVKAGVIEGSMRLYNEVDMDRVKGAFNPQYAQMMKRRKKQKRIKGSNSNQHQNNNDRRGAIVQRPPKDRMSHYMWLLTEGQRLLCLGIFGIIQIFYAINEGQFSFLEWKGLSDRNDRKEGDLDDPNARLGAEELRFNHRFHVFQHVDQPEPLDYSRFRNGLYAYNKQINPTMNNKFEHCQEQLTQATKLFRALQNDRKIQNVPSYQQDYIRDAAKVAIQNRIFVSMLHKKTKFKDGKALRVTHNFDVHQHYVVFQEIKPPEPPTAILSHSRRKPPASADELHDLRSSAMMTDDVVPVSPDSEEPASEF